MKVLLLAVLVAISVGLTTQCPPDVPIFNCLIDPCTTATCPNHPTATCRADYCGGCNARWYLAGSEVTNNCSVSLPSCPSSLDDGQVSICVQACTSNSTCSPGQYCCQKSTCGTACVTPDPCAMIACDIPVCTGGVPPISDNSSCCPYCPPPCSNVTCPIPLCLNGATPTIPEGQCCPQCPSANNGTENASCPMPPAGIIGTCILACTGDDSCPGSQLCCSNGCGRVCTDPVTTTCTGHDGRVYQPGQTFMAADGCNNCTCTSTGLALCTLIACPQGCVDSSGNRHAVGQNFTAPDGCNHCVCTAGGTIACTEIYCPPQNCPARLPAGCVGEDSDCPRCDDGEICCSGCCVASVVTCLDSSGNERQVNETFMAADGCNTCTCTSSGLVACTLRACVDTCSLPSESGLCQAYFPSYFFNSRTGLCERFVYGGCGGNDNRFSTAAECYRRCNASSQCIQPTYSEEQSDLTCLVVVRKWVFNATFGLCGEIAYSPCGQDSEGYNVFDSERECNRSCIRAEEICPSGEPIVRCFADPCSVNSCPGYPDATCRANYCGGCHAYFFDASGNNVTDQCSARVRPTPVLSTVCPVISNGTGGLCAELCTTDASCTAGLICCPNGCGRSCLEPDHIPYYDIPRQCPDSGDGDLTTGSCVFTNASCLTSDECDDGELCCQSGCGRRCTRSVVPSQPCFAVDDELVFSGRPPAGTYIPSCDADSGVFVPVQCHPSTGYCWCVNTRTGRPNSGLYARGVRPNCTTCNYNGKIYHSGDSFPASDGCNTCFCTDSGVVGCTRRACIDTCSLSPDPGPCRGAFSAYYYDRSQGACLPFVYGGCQGNDNKFQTIGDCLRRCNPESRCIQSTPTICIDTFNSSVETGHYVFNSSSNQCQRFPYGCTSLPIYNDLTQCQRSCNPGSTPDPCALVRCAQPDCPQDRWITNPGECCSRCRPPDSVECEDDEFRCNNTRCISSQWVCDGLRDCADGRDEADRLCAMRNQTCLGHRCGDGGCISSDYVCDDYLDCRDASDEANCTTTAFTNVFYPDQLPTRCPNSTGLIGSCVEECSSDNPCQDEGRMCCANGCGHSCIVGVTVAPLCPALARQQYGAIGAFIPECESDGSFSATQCWGSIGYCWCVDTVTGRPISEGMRGEPGCTGCDVDGTVYPHGERFTAEDGCNTCYCSNTGMAFCTREACAPVSCMVLGGEIPHGQMLEDACSSCMCKSGQLNCTRKVCATVGAITQKPPTRVTMDFSGDLDEIAPTDDHKENFQREIMKTLLNRYKTTLGLSQDQIAKIEVKDEEGVTITVEFTESESVSSGANVTLLVGQMEQDYMSSALVIRYNRAVLEPSGDFQVGDDSASSAFPWWGILIIVVGALVLVALVAVVITGVVVKGKGRRHTGASAELNDYSKVSFKNDEDVDVKVDLDK